jgi:hypothetical protein
VRQRALAAKCKECGPTWSPDQDLSDPEDPVVRELVLNKTYQQLADVTSFLTQMCDAAQAYRGCHVIDINLLHDCKQICQFGALTLSVTYALFHTCVSIPKLKSPKLKAQSVESLKAQLNEKGTLLLVMGTTLGPILTAISNGAS